MTAATDDFYVVIGDHRDCSAAAGVRDPVGWFAVRMFVGDQTYDQMIHTHLSQLHDIANTRLEAIAADPHRNLGTAELVDAQRPVDGEGNLMHPGHAVEVPHEVTR